MYNKRKKKVITSEISEIKFDFYKQDFHLKRPDRITIFYTKDAYTSSEI